jgi:hypothetical protein
VFAQDYSKLLVLNRCAASTFVSPCSRTNACAIQASSNSRVARWPQFVHAVKSSRTSGHRLGPGIGRGHRDSLIRPYYPMVWQRSIRRLAFCGSLTTSNSNPEEPTLMKIQQLVIGLTVLNLVILMFVLLRANSAPDSGGCASAPRPWLGDRG